MATGDKLGLGPLETIVNVGWPANSFYCVVSSTAFYVESTNFSGRRGVVALTAAGIRAGGVIVAQRNIDAAPEASNKVSRFIALMRFNKVPDGTDLGLPAFALTLSGAEQFEDFHSTPVIEFCGTSTFTATYGNYRNISPDGGFFIVQDVTYTWVTPAGTSSLTYVNGPLSNIHTDEIGTGARTVSGTSTSIWYIDSFGNYVDEHRPCSELGDPDVPVPSTHTEGFHHVQVTNVSTKTAVPLDPLTWEWNTSNFDVAGGVVLWNMNIPLYTNGVTTDFTPIQLELPNGIYTFTAINEIFLLLPQVRDRPFPQVVTYLSAAPNPRIAYNFQVAWFTNKSTFTDYAFYFTDPFVTSTPGGVVPPQTQLFQL